MTWSSSSFSRARAGRVATQVALARELREGEHDTIRDWILNG
jgi:hypothetical protein